MWILFTCFLLACHIAPYEPPGGKLRQEAHGSFRVTRLFETPDGFFVVEAWHGSDPRNKVCTFETLVDAEEFFRRSVQELPLPCEVVAYEPQGGTLVSEKAEPGYQLRVFAVADGFRLVETRQNSYCHCGNRGRAHEGGDFNVKLIERMYGNHVCVFKTAEEVVRFQERLFRRWTRLERDSDLDLDFGKLCNRAPTLPGETPGPQ